MNVEEIIEFLGGQQFVAANVQSKSGRGNVHQTTVASWCKNNRVPQWYFADLIRLSNGKLTVEQLHNASTQK